MRTTIIWAPHPDDETLYLTGYIDTAINRGDRLLLVAVTDGGASGAKPASWTVGDLMMIRRSEQEAAWRNLTDGKGTVIRMGLSDGNVLQQSVTNLAASLEKIYLNESVEHYVGGSNLATQSEDHRRVANGVKAAGVRVVRGSKAPRDTTSGGTVYSPTDMVAAAAAHASYAAFGWTSVKPDFDALKASGYQSRIIAF
jgi:LmbE family N-acetylglucosaminyl deacetylase